MGLRERLRDSWNRINPPVAPDQRAVVPFDVIGNSDYGLKTTSGRFVNEESAFKFGVAWASMTLIADGIASFEPQAFKVSSEDQSQELTETPQWIRKPHAELRRFDVMNQLLLSVLAWGNAYAFMIRRPSDLQIVGLDVLDPSKVHTEWDPDRPGYRRYKIGAIWYTSFEIFHVQGPTLPGQPEGMSVIHQMREALGLGLTLEEFGARYFGQGSQQKIVIEMPQKVDTEEAKRIVATYERFHKGKANWHRPAIMSGGATLHNISIPPEDSQFLETRSFQAMDIARWFRVPPHRVGIVDKGTSWGSGLAEENLAMLQHTYRPWIQRFEEAFTAYTPGGQALGTIIRLKTEDLLHGTFADMAETYGLMYLSSLITKNEARRPLGLPKVKDGDKFFEPMIQGGMPGEAPKTPKPGQTAGTTVSAGGAKAPATSASTKAKDRKRKQKAAKS